MHGTYINTNVYCIICSQQKRWLVISSKEMLNLRPAKITEKLHCCHSR